MSDSDDFGEDDFISSTARIVQDRITTITSTSSLPSASFLAEEDEEEEDESFGKKKSRKRGRQSKVFGMTEPKEKASNRRSGSHISLLSDDEEENDPPADASDEVNVTPPTTPTLNKKSSQPQVLSVRGGKRTKKTEQALSKLQKLKHKNRDTYFDDSYNEPVVLLEDEVEEIVPIKIRWKHEIKRIDVRLNDRLGVMFDAFANLVNIPVHELVFYHGTNELRRDETPGKMGLGITSFIEARRLFSEGNPEELGDRIEVKLQTKDRKSLVTLKLRPTDKMQTLMEMYAKEKNVDVKTLKFIFDGEQLNPEDTPEDLELEGGECIDVY